VVLVKGLSKGYIGVFLVLLKDYLGTSFGFTYGVT